MCEVSINNEGIRVPSRLLFGCEKEYNAVCEVLISNEGIRIPSSQDYYLTVKKNIMQCV